MLVPSDLAVLQAIQVLLKFQKVLAGIHFFDCCARRQLHEDISLHISLGVGHHEVNRPHVPPQQQGHDENTPNYCPRYHRGWSSRCHQTLGDGLQCTSRSSTSGFLLQDPVCVRGSIPWEEVWHALGLATCE